jgi:hypothetical protein
MADHTNTTLPTDEQRQRAEWDLLLRDLELRAKQNRWESPRAIAMLVLAFAAVFAAGGIANWLIPAKPQVITVRFEQPLSVRLAP